MLDYRDIFISYASEDKDVTKSLADALSASGLSVWFDEYELRLGDSLSRRIEEGLRISRHGVVILSHNFFAKNWPQQELAALRALAKRILPVWHGLNADQVKQYSPLLADVYAKDTSSGLHPVVTAIRKAILEDESHQVNEVLKSDIVLGASAYDVLGVEAVVPHDRTWRYQEMATNLGNAVATPPCIAVAMDFGQEAPVFESSEQDHLRAVVREILGIPGGDDRQDDTFAEIQAMRPGADGRTLLAQFHSEGVAGVWVSRPSLALSWDYMLIEAYRLIRCMCCEAIRQQYGRATRGHATIGVTWPQEGISPDGGCLGLIPATPPSAPPGWRGAHHSAAIEFNADPWPMVQKFGVHSLARAGYRYHEKRIREMAVETVLEIWFPHSDPLRDLLRKYPL